jgi:Second Messenger Oligonucleotide or Dinucleotide Synthetase domain
VKLDDYFAYFLTNTVNLSQFNLDLLDDRVNAIYNALADDEEVGPYVLNRIPQGSWAHQTIITPPRTAEFDADFLLEIAENPQWSMHPKSYIEKVYAALERMSIYEGKCSRKCRCVRVTYANSCHVDVVPYLHIANGREVIVNRDQDDWEDTHPAGFTQWMANKDQITGRKLRKVIRLMKYLRDHKGTFRGARSVILTTVLGNQVEASKKIFDPNYYGSVSTALLHIVEDLDAWLQANPTRPSIVDPSGSGVTFDHRWDDDTYDNFRDRIHDYAAKMRAAYHESDRDASVELWQEIFGPSFTAPEQKKKSSGRFGPVGLVTPAPGRAG